MMRGVPQAIHDRRLFEQDRILVRVAPFAIVYGAALALYPVGGAPTYDAWFAAALALTAGTLAAIACAPWRRLPPVLQITPLLTALLAVACLREAHGGGRSGYAPMVLVPVIWAAAFGGRRTLAVIVVAAALTIALPPALDGTRSYGPGELRRAAITTIVGALAGVVIQLLIGALIEAEARLMRMRAAEVRDDVVQALAVAQLALESGDTATAARSIHGGLAAAQALAAEMLEDAIGRDPEPGALRRSYGST
jgi:hypothetical protein